MKSSIDTIEHLARSEHRIEVLQAICKEPRTRKEIRDLTDASRVTTGRIITDLEERGWVARTGSRYEATTRGRFVTTEFTRLMRNLEAFEALPAVVEWFPEGQPAFDLCLLDDATVITAGEDDLIAPIRRALELIEGADDFKAVGNGASREFIEAIRGAVEDGQTNTTMVPPEAVDALREDPGIRADMRATLESERATLLEYEGSEELPVMQIADGTVALCSGDHRAMVETDDEDIYEWATSYYESLKTEARPVPAESFTGDATVAEDEAFVS